jgi:hypothetical protein
MLRPYRKGMRWRRHGSPDGYYWESPEMGGRVACVPTKTATTANRWGFEAVVTSGVSSNGMSGRKCGERTRSCAVGAANTVSAPIRRKPKWYAMLRRKSEEAIVARKARTTEPAGAKGLYLSRAFMEGGTA